MNKVKVRSKSDEKRQLILAAASECFCDKGFLSTSMDHIAKTAGVSKQTVYSHFGNKDDLFIAAIEGRCQEFRMSSLPKSQLQNPEMALLSFAHGFVDLLLSEEGMSIHRICISESQTNSNISQLFFKAGPEPVIKELADLFASYGEQGVLKIDNPHTAAIQFLSVIKGEAVMRREYNTAQQVSDSQKNSYINDTVKMFLRAYRP